MRSIDTLLDKYSGDHLNPRNQLIHVLCVPAIVWSVSAALWTIPVPEGLLKPGAWAALAMFLAWMYYWRLSRKLAMGIFVCFLAAAWLNHWLFYRFGGAFLLELARKGTRTEVQSARYMRHRVFAARETLHQ